MLSGKNIYLNIPFQAPDIAAVDSLLKEEKIWRSVRQLMENYHSSQDMETRVFSPTTYTTGEDRPEARVGVNPKKICLKNILLAKATLAKAKGNKFSLRSTPRGRGRPATSRHRRIRYLLID